MKNVVVVGGAGFIGSNLAHALVARGDNVHVVDSLVAGKREHVPPAAHFHQIDIRHEGELRALFTSLPRIDCVFHLAALPRVVFSLEYPIETNEVNVGGTVTLLRVAAEAKVSRFVYSGSSSAYGDQEVMPLVESMPAHPKSPYGLQKYIGELYCRLWSEVFELPTVSLRYFNVYGPLQDPDGPYALVIGKFLKQRVEGQALTITGDGTQTRDFTSVHDVVRANLFAMESTRTGRGEVINIGAGKPYTINDIARLVGGPVEYIPARLEPKHTKADVRLAKELLGWEPKVRLEDGIAELKSLAGIE